jgi:rhodanese-related sulfurtransferase
MNRRLQSLIPVIALASSCVAWAHPRFRPFSSDGKMAFVTQCETRHDAELTAGKSVRFRGVSSTAPATRPGAATQPSAGTRVDVATFRKLAVDGGDKVAILDVRTPQEFTEGHLAGAINIDSSSPDFEQKLAALDRDKTYLVYCRTGRRSTQACVALDKLKFPAASLYNLEGGIVAWEKAGETIEK